MAAAGSRSVKVELTFTVRDDSNVEVAKSVVLAESAEEQGSSHFPQKVPASTTDLSIGMGGIASARWVLLRTDNEITLKLNNVGDAGFPIKGVFLAQSETGITDLFVTTGALPASVTVIAVGS